MAFPTNPIYKLVKNLDGDVALVKKQTGTKEPYQVTIMPMDEANGQYQEYLEWVSKGNTPEEAD